MSDYAFVILSTVALIAVVIITVTRPEPPAPAPVYDYEQITACLDARGFPFDTIAEASKSLRFCIEFDQALRGQR